MKVNKSVCFSVTALLGGCLLSAYSQPTSPPPAVATQSVPARSFSPDVNEALKLAQSGLGDEVVLAFVKNCPRPYKLSADDILALKNGGLSSPVLSAMVSHDIALNQRRASNTYEQKAYAPTVPPPAAAVPAAEPPSPASSIPSAAVVPPAPTVPAAPLAPASPAAQPAPPPPTMAPAWTSSVIVEQPPPPPRLEVVTMAPGPDYYWVPGYWGWRGGVWVWVGGSWLHRPRPGLVWVDGRWSRHGRGWIWIGGRWR
jgi:hypothetical protein